MKTIWQNRLAEAAVRYSEAAPMATACCNACRTCATTNAATLALGVAATASAHVTRLARRVFKRSD